MNDAQPAKPSGEPADPAGPTEREAEIRRGRRRRSYWQRLSRPW
ncbi:hypothetical protein [Nocardia brevicatena]|nr:hypothetical protein [Nocardia brevicatena]